VRISFVRAGSRAVRYRGEYLENYIQSLVCIFTSDPGGLR